MTAIPIDALAGVCSATIEMSRDEKGNHVARVPAHPDLPPVVDPSERWAILQMQRNMIDYAQEKLRRQGS